MHCSIGLRDRRCGTGFGSIDTHGTGTVDEDTLSEAVRKNFELKPKGIIESLDLRRPIFKLTARFGHFGRTSANFLGKEQTRPTLSSVPLATEQAFSEPPASGRLSRSGVRLASRRL